jgi:uncharacterized PurR-regulated membrane protein YhhQ (DUF165 family)
MLHYHASPNEVERYNLLLILFLTLGMGGLYLHEHFFKLFLRLLIPLIIGISLYGFIIVDLLNHTCIVCGQGSCGHTNIDCDGSCYDWYTFENEPQWIFTQYFSNWALAVVLTYLLKGFKWLMRGKK